MRIGCAVDRCDETVLEGWALDRDQPDQRLRLDILTDDRPLGDCTANLFRQDLRAAGLGDGHCAFRFALPPLAYGELRRLRVRLTGSDLFLRLPDNAPPGAALPLDGLWIDQPDAVHAIGAALRCGVIDTALADAVYRFARDGWVVLPNVIAPATVRGVNTALRRLWRHPPDGLDMAFFDADGHHRETRPDPHEKQAVLLDPYCWSPLVRQAMGTPVIRQMMMALLRSIPRIFQAEAGPVRPACPPQKDSATVYVGTNPAALLRATLALDVMPAQRAGIEVLTGSHHAPPFLFDTSKWISAQTEAHPDYLHRIEQDARDFPHPRHQITLRPGDVLLCHPDLAHGTTNAEAGDHPGPATLTWHVTAAREEPLYRRDRHHAVLADAGCLFMSARADVVALPSDDCA